METEIVDGREKPTVAALKMLQKGQWIFTCSMKPLQFDSFIGQKKESNYNRSAFTDESWERFSKFDDFKTLEGSHHSVFHCHIKTISEGYAKWFLDNKIDELYDEKQEDPFAHYENEVKKRCQEADIEFEGI